MTRDFNCCILELLLYTLFIFVYFSPWYDNVSQKSRVFVSFAGVRAGVTEVGRLVDASLVIFFPVMRMNIVHVLSL